LSEVDVAHVFVTGGVVRLQFRHPAPSAEGFLVVSHLKVGSAKSVVVLPIVRIDLDGFLIGFERFVLSAASQIGATKTAITVVGIGGKLQSTV